MSDHQNIFESELKKSGWVMKKSRYRQSWKKTWLVLESSNLSYSNSEQGPFKQIPLYKAIIEEAHVSNVKHVFRLKPAKSKKEFLFQAANDVEENNWMQSICFAKVSAHQLNNTSTCTLQ